MSTTRVTATIKRPVPRNNYRAVNTASNENLFPTVPLNVYTVGFKNTIDTNTNELITRIDNGLQRPRLGQLIAFLKVNINEYVNISRQCKDYLLKWHPDNQQVKDFAEEEMEGNRERIVVEVSHYMNMIKYLNIDVILNRIKIELELIEETPEIALKELEAIK